MKTSERPFDGSRESFGLLPEPSGLPQTAKHTGFMEAANVTRHRFGKILEYGDVFTFDPLVRGRGLPMDMEWVSGPRGRDFMTYLTNMRLKVPPMTDESRSSELPYFRDWLSKRKDESGFICHGSGSFRRHIIGIRCRVGGSDGLLEAKINGQDATHRMMRINDFLYGAMVWGEYGAESGVAAPILYVDHSSHHMELYGEREMWDMGMALFQYRDGQRMDDRNFGPIRTPYFNWVAQRNGLSAEGLAEGAGRDVMAVLGRIHSTGILLESDAKLWNYTLCEDGRARYTSDFGSSSLMKRKDYKRYADADVRGLLEQVREKLIDPNVDGKTAQERVEAAAMQAYEDVMKGGKHHG